MKIFKKWWFWVIAIIIAIVLVTSYVNDYNDYYSNHGGSLNEEQYKRDRDYDWAKNVWN